MPVWLAPIAGKVAMWGAVLLAAFLAVWWFKRSIERRKDAEAKAVDSRLRAEAERASHEGYKSELERLKGVDPVSDKPLPPPQ